MGDAHKIHSLLPDVMVYDSPGYPTVRIHAQGVYQLVYRLVALGQKVAMVARRVDANHKVSYAVSERFGEGGTSA